MATILLADDEDIIRTLVRRVLTKAGHKVLEAHNGLEATNLFPREQVDLVITDMIMPGKDGAETIAELLANDPSVRIIAISGGGRGNLATTLAHAKDLGARKTLAKPFTLNEFLHAVEDTLHTPPPQVPHHQGH